MKVTIIGDALIKGETMKAAVIDSGLASERDIKVFSWFEKLSTPYPCVFSALKPPPK